MRIDDQTARDLEIFQAPAGAPSLFDLLDRTRTSGGREALRARFRNPLSDARQIASVQESLRFIHEHRAIFDALPRETEIAAVARYLRSNVVPGAARGGFSAVAETLWTRLAYPDLFRTAVAGAAATRRILDAIGTFLSAPALTAAQGESRAILEEMSAVAAHREITAIRRRRADTAGWLHVLRDDRMIREDAHAGIDRLFRLLFEIDALVSMADATHERRFVLPQVLNTRGEVDGEGLYHPFLTDPVPNDLRLNDSRRVLFLTGPNMAGKTTYLRACGIAAYLAHLGMGVPARRLRISVFDSLLTAIGLSDDVRRGISFFRAEALRVKEVARSLGAGHSVLAIFDEPFKGTNVRDALDASREILLRLARASGSAFLVASHLIELAEVLRPVSQIASQRFDAEENGRELRYDYVARPGVSAQRLGMRVLEQEGVFELLDASPGI